jgi:hypothetical protein
MVHSEGGSSTAAAVQPPYAGRTTTTSKMSFFHFIDFHLSPLVVARKFTTDEHWLAPTYNPPALLSTSLSSSSNHSQFLHSTHNEREMYVLLWLLWKNSEKRGND